MFHSDLVATCFRHFVEVTFRITRNLRRVTAVMKSIMLAEDMPMVDMKQIGLAKSYGWTRLCWRNFAEQVTLILKVALPLTRAVIQKCPTTTLCVINHRRHNKNNLLVAWFLPAFPISIECMRTYTTHHRHDSDLRSMATIEKSNERTINDYYFFSAGRLLGLVCLIFMQK